MSAQIPCIRIAQTTSEPRVNSASFPEARPLLRRGESPLVGVAAALFESSIAIGEPAFKELTADLSLTL